MKVSRGVSMGIRHGLFFLILNFGCSALANDAGCGLGSLVIQRNTKFSQCLAVTTNQTIFFNQLLGITSGTSNCSANGFAFRDKEAIMFAEANLPSLKVEMARGQGENLTAFSQVLGCKDLTAFSNLGRAKYQNIFPTQNVQATQMLDNLRAEIKKDDTMRSVCTFAVN